MNITTGLIGKGLIGLGTVGAAAGGILVLKSAGSSSGNRDHVFYEKVEDIMKKVGLKGWCKRVKGERKYVCDGKSSVEGLKKIRFASKNNEQEYEIRNSYVNVDMEIMEFNDGVTFPGRIGFMLKNTAKLLKVDMKGSGKSQNFINIGPKGELKFDEKKNALVWAWEDINDLANKAGLKCEVKKKCTTNNTTINIIDGNNRVEGVTLEVNGVEWTYGDNYASYFQGYGFKPSGDIKVKYDDGSKVIGGKKIEKISKNSQYEIIRDKENVSEWYLAKFVNK